MVRKYEDHLRHLLPLHPVILCHIGLVNFTPTLFTWGPLYTRCQLQDVDKVEVAVTYLSQTGKYFKEISSLAVNGEKFPADGLQHESES